MGNEVVPPGMLILKCGQSRPVATVAATSLSQIERTARQFFEIPGNCILRFYAVFEGIEDGLIQIDPVLWPQIYQSVKILSIETSKPRGDDSSSIASAASSTSSSTHRRDLGFQFFVKISTGKTITIFAGSDDTVANTKHNIMLKEGIPVLHQRLVYRSRRLEDERRLLSCGIAKDSTVHLDLIQAPHSDDDSDSLTLDDELSD